MQQMQPKWMMGSPGHWQAPGRTGRESRWVASHVIIGSFVPTHVDDLYSVQTDFYITSSSTPDCALPLDLTPNFLGQMMREQLREFERVTQDNAKVYQPSLTLSLYSVSALFIMPKEGADRRSHCRKSRLSGLSDFNSSRTMQRPNHFPPYHLLHELRILSVPDLLKRAILSRMLIPRTSTSLTS